MCLDSEELILPEEPVLPENPTAHQRRMRELRAAAVVKNEETLRQNMWSLYVVVMLLCDTSMEELTHKSYAEMKHTRDNLKLLQVIKQFMYSNSGEELHMLHNKLYLQSACLGWGKKGGSHHNISRIILQQWDKSAIKWGSA